MHQQLSQKIGLILLWLVLLFAPGISPAAAEDAPTGRTTATFSYTTNDPKSAFGVPLVQVQLDKGLSATFAIDTGANPSLISDTLATKLGLTPAPFLPSGRPFLSFGKPAQFVDVAHLNMGNLHIEKQTLIVADAKMLSSIWRHPVDGVIGINVLAAFAVFFDFPHHHVVVWSPGGFSAEDIEKSAFKDAAAIPLKLETDLALLSAPVELGNGSLTVSTALSIDTGADLTSIPAGVARHLKLMPTEKHMSTSRHGNVEMSKAYVFTFRLGTLPLNNQQVTYPSQEKSVFPTSLGMDFFSSRYVLFDFPNNRMYILAPSLDASTKEAK